MSLSYYGVSFVDEQLLLQYIDSQLESQLQKHLTIDSTRVYFKVSFTFK